MRKISIKYRILIIIILIQIPFQILLQIYTGYTTGNMNTQLAKGYSETLQVFCNAVNTQLANAHVFLSVDCWGNPEFRRVAAAESKTDVQELLKPTIERAEILLDNNIDLSGIFFYSEKTSYQYNLYSPHNSFTAEKYLQMDQLAARMLREGTDINTSWSFWENEGIHYIARLFEYEGVFVTVLVDLQQLSGKAQTYYNMSTPVVFSRGDQMITEAYWSRYADKALGAWDPKQDYQMITSRGNEYLIVAESIMTMTALYGVRYKYNWNWLNVVIYLSIAVSIFSFLLAWLCLHITFFKPLKNLLGVMNLIRSGEYTARAERIEDVEFSIINDTFNDTLDTVENLKIQTYENQIKAKNSQMNALRLQIRRHFFLNCLKNIYAMARSGDTDDIQQSVLLLSEHLRYTLDISKNTVKLQTELEMCRNYIELQGIGQERKPVLTVHLEDGLETFQVPPVSILTLIENCCKYGMTQDKVLEVTIDVSLRSFDEEQFVNIVVLDNGFGFSEDKLYKLNIKAEVLVGDGHVGIANVMTRMKMMYGDKCTMIFANAEGASIELIIPLQAERLSSG